ncbi:MAG: hemerythrin domain-containing protein [Rhodocyclales bacterium]|nr:hemerythrin domain-containing protein [Rhodocyclales bacterium]
MFLFDLLFGKRKESAPAVAPARPEAPSVPVRRAARPDTSAPGTSIHHDVELIASLKSDHQRLLATFRNIAAASMAGNLVVVQSMLGQFQTMLMDHLLKENVRLYVYLEHLLKDDPVSHEMMHGFRHEMDAIGRVVVGFLGKYKEIGSHPELAGTFAADLKGIGEALVARIKREEDILYPMYSPPT